MTRVRQASGVSLAAVLAVLLLQLAAAVGAPQGPDAPALDRWLGGRQCRFDLTHGRIILTVTNPNVILSQQSGDSPTEKFTARVQGKGIVLTYEHKLPAETLSIEADNQVKQLRIRRIPKGQSTVIAVDFAQGAEEPLLLSIDAEGKRQVYRAATVWHLLLAEPEVCRQHLLPLLRVLKLPTDLHKTAEDLEAELLHIAATQDPPDRKRWAVLVAQLADERFSAREAADGELRQVGQGVVGYLRGLDRRRLDAEQTFRISRIIRTFSKDDKEDDAPSVAEWMAGDARVWLILLSRDLESTRRAATRRLVALLGQPIAFDPAAPLEVRKQQIEKLQSQIASGGGR